jgi:hypothetical protein
VTKPRPLGNRAAELVDQALRHLRYSREQLATAERKQDRHPDSATLLRIQADRAIVEAENLILRVRTGQYEE